VMYVMVAAGRGRHDGTALPRESAMDLIFAYIDPGSGSLVIQALIAGLVAVPIFFRRQIARIVGSLRGHDDPTEQVAAQDDPPKGA
jgi:hypothetical protein